MNRARIAVGAWAVSVLLAGCQSVLGIEILDETVTEDGGTATCEASGDCSDAMTCDDATSNCVPGGECLPPNVLLVLDRSCSLRGDLNGSTKWEIVVAAINTMTKDYVGKIRFGLTLFPEPGHSDDCLQSEIPVPVGRDNEQTIQDLLTTSLDPLDKYYPYCEGTRSTNIDAAMQQAATDPALRDATRDSYVVLLTDGSQAMCYPAGGDEGTTQIIRALHDDEGVSTFVLGFGDNIDPAQMDIFAEAGGVPSADPTSSYYKALDRASLDKALEEIANKMLGCGLDQRDP